MITDNNQKICKNLVKYCCEYCNYITSDKRDYNKHLLTRKHKLIINNNGKSVKICKEYICSCGKVYKYASGLSLHKKKCIIIFDENNDIKNNAAEIIVDDNKDYKNMFLEMMNQNKELHNIIKELIPKVGTNHINNTNTNTNNINIKIDNITLLNDKCKDALSISDFIESIEIEVKDLMFTSQKGLTNGVSNLFIEQLNNLPLLKRPIWCVDKKRKKLLIKEDAWSEDTNQKKTKEAIKTLTVKQAKNINKYKNENPDWFNNDKKKEKFIEIVKEATTELDEIKQSNIINNLLETIHLTNDHKETLQNVTE